ncbi:MAG: hypothetical protein EAS52_24115 [Parapedobacter sp.]|nr:MAG: hypothetical protein EAS52_24115 [Parapedobacter sp.]
MDAITNRKKGGRPKKAAEETRNKSIHILCLASEHQELKRLAKSYGLTISEYVLKKAFDRRLVFNHVEFMQELDKTHMLTPVTGMLTPSDRSWV